MQLDEEKQSIYVFPARMPKGCRERLLAGSISSFRQVHVCNLLVENGLRFTDPLHRQGSVAESPVGPTALGVYQATACVATPPPTPFSCNIPMFNSMGIERRRRPAPSHRRKATLEDEMLERAGPNSTRMGALDQ